LAYLQHTSIKEKREWILFCLASVDETDILSMNRLSLCIRFFVEIQCGVSPTEL
jgi:hypothetical protein